MSVTRCPILSVSNTTSNSGALVIVLHTTAPPPLEAPAAWSAETRPGGGRITLTVTRAGGPEADDEQVAYDFPVGDHQSWAVLDHIATGGAWALAAPLDRAGHEQYNAWSARFRAAIRYETAATCAQLRSLIDGMRHDLRIPATPDRAWPSAE
jgi:hypothetical protein